jgi:hypothetical protein
MGDIMWGLWRRPSFAAQTTWTASAYAYVETDATRTAATTVTKAPLRPKSLIRQR